MHRYKKRANKVTGEKPPLYVGGVYFGFWLHDRMTAYGAECTLTPQCSHNYSSSTNQHTEQHMKLNSFLMSIIGLAVLVCHVTACGRGPDTVVATLSVSSQQEENFNSFMAWLDTHSSLKQNDSLKSAYQVAFAALKNNDYNSYVREVGRLNSLLNKLSATETNDMYNFFQTLIVPTVTPMQPKGGAGGRCEVSCLFGSCSVECPAGTKPTCFCQGGNPNCGCEPYSKQ